MKDNSIARQRPDKCVLNRASESTEVADPKKWAETLAFWYFDPALDLSAWILHQACATYPESLNWAEEKLQVESTSFGVLSHVESVHFLREDPLDTMKDQPTQSES